jgi:hypothetical protein
MVDYLRRSGLSPDQPRPSIEMLLHVFVSPPHVDHTHPDAVIAVTYAPDGRRLADERSATRSSGPTGSGPASTCRRRIAELLEAQPGARAVLLEGSSIGSSGWKAEGRRPTASPRRTCRLLPRAHDLGVNVYAEDVAEAIAFLGGPRSAKSRGNLLNVEGGIAAAYPRWTPGATSPGRRRAGPGRVGLGRRVAASGTRPARRPFVRRGGSGLATARAGGSRRPPRCALARTPSPRPGSPPRPRPGYGRTCTHPARSRTRAPKRCRGSRSRTATPPRLQRARAPRGARSPSPCLGGYPRAPRFRVSGARNTVFTLPNSGGSGCSVRAGAARAAMNDAVPGWQQWQRSTFVRVRSRVRLLPGFRSTCTLDEQQRTGANACSESTSWGSLVRAQYRPSKKPCKRAFLLFREATRGEIVARIAGSWRGTFSDAPPAIARARIPISGEIPATTEVGPQGRTGPKP